MSGHGFDDFMTERASVSYVKTVSRHPCIQLLDTPTAVIMIVRFSAACIKLP